MRGTVSNKLEDFLEQVNIAAAEAKKNQVQYTPELVRGNLEKLAVFIGQGPTLNFVENRVLAKEDSQHDHNVSVRVYSPSTTEKLPVLVHFHGGGHMCGNVNLYDPISRKLARQCKCIVICVEYRLAPEHPYPAGLNDCEQVLIHYKKLLTGLNFSEQVYIIGDSAGGAICTSLAMRSLHNPAIKIDKQLLIYPSVDYTMRLPSVEENGTGFLLEKPRIQWYFDNYFRGGQSRIEASPLYNIHNKIPPTMIITAGCDPLRDEGRAYYQALQNAGIVVEHHHFEGMIHAYMLLDSLVSDECQKTYQLISDAIQA
ncbi:alpha/beta hydrolase [Thalassotalea sp. PLHSN55]|uniref:alpha/beta hydrolase n=1 Tax=Thalassotalea sp. PLHSN55 TaxID=3435888 RepID=UPI003F847E44